MRDAWDDFAAREPYFAVITDPRYLSERFDAEAEQAFFGGGDDQVEEILRFIRSHGAPIFEPKSILEYGCGVGRLLLPFARRSVRAVGVDVSPSMLAHARERAARAELDNVEVVDAAAFDDDGRQFDLVNCFLLLQRLRRGEGLALVRRLAGRVRDGGFLVVQFPFRAHVAAAVRTLRGARARVPAVNALMNVARGKPASTPFVGTTTYDLNDVFALMHEVGFDEPLTRYVGHGDLDSVIVTARKEHRFDSAGTPAGEEPQPVTAVPAPAPAVHTDAVEAEAQEDVRPAGFIDVKKLIAEKSIEELNRTAEEYFASLKWWDDHLAKPFSRIADVPQLLIGFGVLVQGLNLVRGMTVLEYGAGTGWLSRFLTQLGCRTILLDVSPTALKIARELFERQPVFGERPSPEFLVFDGRKIDLPDASVDRIICFDAFHHAPNPEEVLGEFRRVLKPGGVAGFAEPGPWHSTTPQSQFEMRTYGVVENDVDVHALRAAAKRHGFADMRLAVFNVPPFLVSLEDFDDFLAAGETWARWAHESRSYMRAVRTFFLQVEGSEELDSRRPEGLRAEIDADAPERVPAGEPIPLRVTIRNSGPSRWLPSDVPVGGVSLGVHLYRPDGQLIDFDLAWQYLPQALAPEESVTVEFTLPPQPPGDYLLELDCVSNAVAWFAQVGSQTRRVSVSVS